ncbi:MAG: cytochrome c [Verrucomicrobia bacterium]|nr:cytochrome c [Verrucomicrobiota bacterium]
MNPAFNWSAVMKMKLVAILLAGLLAGGLAVGLAQNKKSRATKEFMRDKLELAQGILEGLSVENYALIISRSQKLSAMSQQADWKVFENPDYEQQSIAFRRNVDALTKAAKNKNLDGATLAYVRVTMSCVECHKYVRGRLVASLN